MGPWTCFDRVVLAVPALDAAVGCYSELLGRAPAWRGSEPDGASTALFQLANGALELRQTSEAGPTGVVAISFGSEDLDESAEFLERRGLHIVRDSVRESHAPSGGKSRRRELELDLAQTRGVRVSATQQIDPPDGFLLSDLVPGATDDSAAAGIDHIVVRTVDSDASIVLYRDQLGLRLALDRSFPERGTRLSFFRLAGVTIELASRAVQSAGEDRPDALWGIAYQVSEAHAARERVAAAGFDVSEVRYGNKPGTRVCTVRAETYGVPTLLIGSDHGA